MGFLKKLFESSTDNSSDDRKKNDNHQTLNSISQPAHNPNMTSWENFFGVNLKSSPNDF